MIILIPFRVLMHHLLLKFKFKWGINCITINSQIPCFMHSYNLQFSGFDACGCIQDITVVVFKVDFY